MNPQQHHTGRRERVRTFVKTCELADKISQWLDASAAATLWVLVAQCAGQTEAFTRNSDSTAFV